MTWELTQAACPFPTPLSARLTKSDFGSIQSVTLIARKRSLASYTAVGKCRSAMSWIGKTWAVVGYGWRGGKFNYFINLGWNNRSYLCRSYFWSTACMNWTVVRLVLSDWLSAQAKPFGMSFPHCIFMACSSNSQFMTVCTADHTPLRIKGGSKGKRVHNYFLPA